MPDIKTARPYKERLLDGFDRSRLREEVKRVRGSRFYNLRKRYATMVLGASLAMGGIGIPIRSAGRGVETPVTAPAEVAAAVADGSLATEIAQDMKTATSIAMEVTAGVTTGVNEAAKTLASPLKATAPQHVAAATEHFFKKEIPFGQIIYQEAKKNDLDPALVAAVVKTESRFIPTARSGAGAQGLMQLVPRTGRWMGARNLMNPNDNIKAGTKYLAYLNERFDGDETKVLAAYNAGEGNVKRFGGVPPFKETRNYVKKVKASREEFNEQLGGHVADLVQSSPMIASSSALSR